MSKRTGRLISILYRKGQIHLGKLLKSCNVGASEFPVLLYLYHQDGVTQEDLVAYMCLDKSAVARIIQSLLSKNYITKAKDSKDQRCNRIYITPKGLKLKSEIEASLDAWHTILMKDFTDDEKAMTNTLLKRMVENIKGD